MMRFYELDEDKASRHTGYASAVPKWGLPGSLCPECDRTWVVAGLAYPCVDLSSLPERTLFEEARRESIEEFERLRELARPLVPPGALLLPGTKFGPSVGTATGRFGAFYFLPPFQFMVRREVLEKLQAAGIHGLRGCRAQLRFRQKNAPELWELQLEQHGRLHRDCLPADSQPPCPRCGGDSNPIPEPQILEATSMPTDCDLFMLPDTLTILCSERFVEATRRLELDGVTFKELPLR
jgi:uncharacterized double-CXXCG motif protein